jgi:hypothetical protein
VAKSFKNWLEQKFLLETTVSQALKSARDQAQIKSIKNKAIEWLQYHQKEELNSELVNRIAKWATYMWLKKGGEATQYLLEILNSFDYLYGNQAMLLSRFNDPSYTLEQYKKEAKGHETSRVLPSGNYKRIIFLFPSGLRWVDIGKNYDADEDKSMRLNLAKVRDDVSGNTTLYSLRDQKNIPYATVIMKDSQVYDFGGRSKSVEKAKYGFGRSDPFKKYSQEMKWLVDNFGIHPSSSKFEELLGMA